MYFFIFKNFLVCVEEKFLYVVWYFMGYEVFSDFFIIYSFFYIVFSLNFSCVFKVLIICFV